MKKREEDYDVVICGGGLAGFCAAIAAARGGARTCLLQDRPVLGGNSSSEVRVTPHGAAAFHVYARETGIISEVLIEDRARNHETVSECGWMNSVWDMTLYDLAQRTPGLTLRLGTTILAVEIEGAGRIDQTPPATTRFGYLHRPAVGLGRRLAAVIGRIANAETDVTVRGRYFLDCTGDGIVADLAGCEWRMGSESREEFDEPHAPAAASRDTMGNSIHFRARDTGGPAPYQPPAWAKKYDDAAFFYEQGRRPDKDFRGGYWWIEIGVPWDTIHDHQDIRHELTRHALGVWDWIKNKDPKLKSLAANYALDWIGQVPGKRESRRVMGRHLMKERDFQPQVRFPDEVAFGGWFIDLHTPGGLLAATSEASTAEGYTETTHYAQISYVGPYGIPLRALVAQDLDNLLMAGRNISATHAALGTMRVMCTCATMGQAAGTAAAHASRVGRDPAAFRPEDVRGVQQRLLREGCFLPNIANEDPDDLARSATVAASSEEQFAGAGPDEPGCHENLSYFKDLAVPTGRDELVNRRGQWIAVGADRIETLAVCLSNFSGKTAKIRTWLVPTEHIWDYRLDSGKPLAEGEITVPPGEKQWVTWSPRVPVAPGRMVRLDLGASPDVAWLPAGRLVPGQMAAFDMGNGLMRRYGKGVTMSFRITPSQRCFPANQVISGVARPRSYTNLWCSDPNQMMPQWVQLEWTGPRTIHTVELTFPGHLIREYNAYGPFYRDPQCPRDYRVEGWEGGEWTVLCRVEGNYQRHRRHAISPAGPLRRLRVTVTATNGDPRAAIYEIRCYSA